MLHFWTGVFRSGFLVLQLVCFPAGRFGGAEADAVGCPLLCVPRVHRAHRADFWCSASQTCSSLYKIIKTWELKVFLHVQLNIKCWVWFLLVLSYNRVNFKNSPSISISQKDWDKLLIWQIYKESAESQKRVYWGSVWQVLVLCRISWSHSLAAELRNCSSLFQGPPEPAFKLPWHVTVLVWQGGHEALGALRTPSPSFRFSASKSLLPPTGAK